MNDRHVVQKSSFSTLASTLGGLDSENSAKRTSEREKGKNRRKHKLVKRKLHLCFRFLDIDSRRTLQPGGIFRALGG